MPCEEKGLPYVRWDLAYFLSNEAHVFSSRKVFLYNVPTSFVVDSTTVNENSYFPFLPSYPKVKSLNAFTREWRPTSYA